MRHHFTVIKKYNNKTDNWLLQYDKLSSHVSKLNSSARRGR